MTVAVVVLKLLGLAGRLALRAVVIPRVDAAIEVRGVLRRLGLIERELRGRSRRGDRAAALGDRRQIAFGRELLLGLGWRGGDRLGSCFGATCSASSSRSGIARIIRALRPDLPRSLARSGPGARKPLRMLGPVARLYAEHAERNAERGPERSGNDWLDRGDLARMRARSCTSARRCGQPLVRRGDLASKGK